MSIALRAMSRLPISGALSALLLTAACATQPGTNASMASLPALTEPPARHGDYQWFFDREDDEYQLFYGMAQSDDIPLGLTCTSGSGRIKISTPSEDNARRTLSLTSGGQVATYPARVSEAVVFDGYDIISQTTTADPVMQTFALNGWMAMAGKDGWVGLVGDGSSRQLASQFMTGCKR